MFRTPMKEKYEHMKSRKTTYRKSISKRICEKGDASFACTPGLYLVRPRRHAPQERNFLTHEDSSNRICGHNHQLVGCRGVFADRKIRHKPLGGFRQTLFGALGFDA